MQEAIDTLTRRIQMLDEDAGWNEASIMAAGFGHKNMIEPAAAIDDESPRQKIIQQGGEMAAEVYGEIDRLRAAADFNDDVPVEPQRPRHVCPACGLGHSIGQCNPMTVEEAVALGGKPIMEIDQ